MMTKLRAVLARMGSYVSTFLSLTFRAALIGLACGMAGLFGAVFGTPVTAAVFSMEVGTVGILRYAALYPCLLSSLTAWEVSRLLGGTGVRFALAVVPEATLPVVLKVVALALRAEGAVRFFLGLLWEFTPRAGNFSLYLFSTLFNLRFIRIFLSPY